MTLGTIIFMTFPWACVINFYSRIFYIGDGRYFIIIISKLIRELFIEENCMNYFY